MEVRKGDRNAPARKSVPRPASRRAATLAESFCFFSPEQSAGCWRVVFSSHIFIFYFLPLALLGYYALAGAPQRWRNFWLIVTGYVFYGWAEPRFMLLMFATTSIDWVMSLVIAHDSWRFWKFRGQPVSPLARRRETLAHPAHGDCRLRRRESGRARLLQVLQLRRR